MSNNTLRAKTPNFEIPDLRGKVFVVTGGNAGIGLATVTALAAKGATVVLACRSPEKGQAAAAQICLTTPGAKIETETLDLASLASVRNFAERLVARLPRLDALINNAGVLGPPLGYTEDGFETQFGVNMLGHFALTGRLLPLLAATPAARVVSLSSLAHWFGHIDFDNLNAEHGYDKRAAYNQSKLACLVFAYELQRRLLRTGGTTRSVAAHPGVTTSDLFRHGALPKLASIACQPTHMGALPSLMAAASPQVDGGDYVGPGGLFALRGLPRLQRSSRKSHDQQLGARLWEVSQQLTGVHYLND